jgi:hypothetical protein
MERSVRVPSRVEDLVGLQIDLRRAGFAVRGVGADPRSTHVYLDLSEEKDPVSIVERWIGRPAPEPTKKLVERRKRELETLDAEDTRRRDEAVRRAAEEGSEEGTKKKVSWIRKILGMRA